RHHKTQGAAVLRFERLALPRPGEQHVLVEQRAQRNVRGVTVEAVEHAMLRVRSRLRLGDQGRKPHALPGVVETAPGGYTVEVRGQGDARKCSKLLPVELERPLDETFRSETPLRHVRVRHGRVVQYRPLLGQGLAWRRSLLKHAVT